MGTLGNFNQEGGGRVIGNLGNTELKDSASKVMFIQLSLNILTATRHLLALFIPDPQGMVGYIGINMGGQT